jgi:predicted Rdx family selenoprotein
MTSTLPHLRSIVDHDGAVILDTQRGEMWNLNPSGAFIWQRLLDGRLPEQIAIELSARNGDDLQSATRDLEQFLDELKEKHLFSHHVGSQGRP